MELAINISNLSARYDFETCIDIYKKAGFTAMDYSLGDMTKDESVFNADDYRTTVEGIRKIVDAKGMPVVQTHAPFHFSLAQWDTPEIFESVVFPRFVRCLEISAMLGAKIAVVHPLHHMTYHGHEEEIFELNMNYYRRLIPYCREYGIKVGIENMFQVDPKRKCIVHDTCSRAEELIRYVDTLDSEYMVACLDVGHVSLPLQDDEAPDIIRALGHDRLQSLHIHDNDYRGDQHMPPYFGKLNWAEIAKALGEIDYQGDFTYEAKAAIISTCDEEFVPIAAKFLGDIGNHIISMIEKNRIVK